MKGWLAFFSINPLAEIVTFGLCFQNPPGFRERLFLNRFILTCREEPYLFS